MERDPLALARYPRVRLLAGPTPIQRLPRIESALGSALNGARLFAKRDDGISLGGGGGKLRKLEFLFGEALSLGADTIISTGAWQSNSAGLAAAAAARLGLWCELVLRPLPDGNEGVDEKNGNALLDELFGAVIHALPDAAAAGRFASERRALLEAAGRVVYLLPAGASSARASLGYVECAFEIAAQERAMGIRFDHIVVANGSAGTQAGLVAGFAHQGRSTVVHGYSVLAEAAAASATTLMFARGACELLGEEDELRSEDVRVSDAFRGPGYGHLTPEAVDAIRLLAAQEGLLLDPVYSGKAFAGLLSQARRGEFMCGENVLFLMTGGAPALFAYRASLSEPRQLSAQGEDSTGTRTVAGST